MCFEVMFVLYISNMTLPSVSQSTTTQTRLECNHLAFSQGNKSYFYNNVNKTCIIYPTIIYRKDSLVSHPGFEYFVEDGPACGPPPVPKGHKLLEVIGSPGNYTARYKCGQYYIHRQIGETRCIGNSDWTETPCQDFASCETIKECNSSYTTDGEYIHYPGILNSSSVRLYCHNMNTSSPKTYLTLNATNVFDVPTGRCYGGHGCEVYPYTNPAQGKTTFTKVAIDTEQMSSMNHDYTFTIQDFGTQRPYGWVFCCSLSNIAMCLRGRSTIDLTNTGLMISNSTSWSKTGHLSHFTVNRTDFVVQLRGDGSCGGARPTGNLIQFVKDQQYVMPDDTIDPQCSLLGI
ncbi:hypothetical protein LOTGIDRAFT_162934 [Lottia gigantea]|uniref:GON domain-containing protein n=1 Tax=Lottia gigantea TaxID=225164 RepID=V3ZKR0_LOTGI|nr:hypothetical protein LOTGIDRAFT_162934 [Lottia gigantea]ESO91933.1 hypothetical protein LOTGIDRAFT_162934 [Lottia gigantea]